MQSLKIEKEPMFQWAKEKLDYFWTHLLSAGFPMTVLINASLLSSLFSSYFAFIELGYTVQQQEKFGKQC